MSKGLALFWPATFPLKLFCSYETILFVCRACLDPGLLDDSLLFFSWLLSSENGNLVFIEAPAN